MATIVVGVDPSTACRKALASALREALFRGAEVVAVRAWTPLSFALSYPIASVVTELEQEVAAEAKTLAEEQLKLAVDAVPGADAVPRHALAVHGPAAQVLVEAAREAMLLVVGSHGHGALSRAVLGSVSSPVLHHAAGPVAVVPASAEVGPSVQRVLVGVDHSAQSRDALRSGIEEASLHDAPLVPVHVHQHVVTARSASTCRTSSRPSAPRSGRRPPRPAPGSGPLSPRSSSAPWPRACRPWPPPLTWSSSAPAAGAASPICCSAPPAPSWRSTRAPRSWWSAQLIRDAVVAHPPEGGTPRRGGSDG